MTAIELGQFYPVETGTLPDTWVAAYVGDFAGIVQSGFACGQHGRDNGVPHLRPMNVSRDGEIDLSDVKTVHPDFNEKRLRQGDVLFNNTNSPELVGKTAFVTERGNGLAFSNHMTQVQVANGISAEFMALQLHHLWSQKYFFHRCVKHVNQASISATELANRIPFVCPPSNEQRRIVEKVEALFDEIDKGVESLKKARATLGLYRQSLLKAAFEGRLTADWRAKNADTLEDPKTLLARIQDERDTRYKAALDDWQEALTTWRADGEKGKKPAKPKRPVWPGKFNFAQLRYLPKGWCYLPFEALAWSIRNGISAKPDGKGPLKIFRISAVRCMAFDLDDFRRITDNENSFENYRLAKGDLVFTRYNGSRDYVGVSAMYLGDGSHVYPDKLIRCEIKSDILNPAFLEAATNCGESRAFIERRIRTTAGQSGISGGDIKVMPVPICSPAEQAEIVRILDEKLEAADAMEAEIDAALTGADALRQSILKKAFSGQLVPQDPDDEPASALLARIKAEREAPAKKPRKKVSA